MILFARISNATIRGIRSGGLFSIALLGVLALRIVLGLFFAYRIRKRDDAKADNGETGDDDPKAKGNGKKG